MIHIFSRNDCEEWCVIDETYKGSYWNDSLANAISSVKRLPMTSRYVVDIGRKNPGCTYYGLFKDYNDFVAHHPELFI